ncbi:MULTISPECIES: hypothetical protein [Escherichia]|uniref:hypothetical protein n=1 Tax=Escherichia TaxID=561 RepID=UPI000BE5C140|nr:MULTISPECIES: hypothetical protein [Escherichia]
MTSPKTGKPNNKSQSSCPNRTQGIQNGRPITIGPKLKRKEKISFDSADKLAEEIAALRDKKS